MAEMKEHWWYTMLGLLLTIQCQMVHGQTGSCDGHFEFRCSTDECIYDGFRCDRENDCTNNADELNCPSPTCGGIRTTTSGVISSPGYPYIYPVNSKCTWIIRGPEETFIQLTFTSFDLQPASGGCYDWLQILQSKERDNIGIFCGSTLDGQVLRSLGNYLWLQFNSDLPIIRTGFRVEYEIKQCDEYTFTCSSGGCVPFFDECDGQDDCGDNSDEQNCLTRECNSDEFTCDVPDNRRCIKNFEICDGTEDCADGKDEAESSCNCRDAFDYLCDNDQCIYDGFVCDTEDDCQDNSDELNCPVATCGGQLTATSGVISSPNYPLNYPNNAKCTWIIQGPPNTFITVQFTALDVQEPRCCDEINSTKIYYCYDWVEIFEIKSDSAGELFCRDELSSESYTSAGNYLLIQFRSDSETVASGFRLEYSIDDNECAVAADNNCHHVCTNTPGSYTCSCNIGYTLDANGYTCNDYDECVVAADNSCDHVCTNTVGSYACACNIGYTLDGDGHTCNDDNECAVAADNNCHHVCTNTPGSYTCSCNIGYTLDANGYTCNDYDECVVAADNSCDHVCTNTVGSYACACNIGYTLDGDGHTCNDDNECAVAADNNCHHVCTNTPGSYTCSCNIGYTLDANGYTCNDYDECVVAADNSCDHVCTNTVGSYACACNIGYTLDGDGHTCNDNDECAFAADNTCDKICTNTPGSFICSCNIGYIVDADGYTCNDDDECAVATENNCDHVCTNTVGSYACACNIGYTLDGDGHTCNDDNECVSNPCKNDGRCTNLENAYKCTCFSAFSGPNCENKNECVRSPCKNGGRCTELENGYKCTCPSAFTGTNCEDENVMTVLVASSSLTLEDTFMPSLLDKNSNEYKEMAKEFEALMMDLLSEHFDDVECEVTGFRNGSVVVDFLVRVTLPEADNGTEPSEVEKEVKLNLQDAIIEATKNSSLGRFTVQPESFSISSVSSALVRLGVCPDLSIENGFTSLDVGGRSITTLSPGIEVVFYCDSKFVLKGTSKIYCADDFTWSNPPPKCIRPDTDTGPPSENGDRVSEKTILIAAGGSVAGLIVITFLIVKVCRKSNRRSNKSNTPGTVNFHREDAGHVNDGVDIRYDNNAYAIS